MTTKEIVKKMAQVIVEEDMGARKMAKFIEENFVNHKEIKCDDLEEFTSLVSGAVYNLLNN